MDFFDSQQVNPEELNLKEFDLVIGAFNAEDRGLFFVANQRISGKRKFAISNIHNSNFLKKRNERFLKEQGYLILTNKSSEIIKRHLQEILVSSVGNKNVEILVDYSCMTTFFLSEIIHFITSNDSNVQRISVYFAYCPAIYSLPIRKGKFMLDEKNVRPVFVNGRKPAALLLGLGIIPGRAEAIVKQIKPELLLLVIADPAASEEYVKECYRANEELISKTDSRHIFSYPLNDPAKISGLIKQRCMDIRLDHNVLIASLGPKVFTLNALLVASQYPDVSLIDIGIKKIGKQTRKYPSGEIILQHVNFTQSEG